ncbi:MAG: sulfatase-like hydrolase/transferase [Deltaproteobacteria bacterium]|nr:sulfatase-like hydrolase/transferase [Deltaproteobacteria bacterium]
MRPSRGFLLFVSFCGVLLFLTWPLLTTAPRPHILLITIDTLRPDALGWVAQRNATPHFDRLASEGVAFPAAVSPVPLTLPAHTSMMTGLLPRHHRVQDNGHVVDARLTTLAEILRDQGYDTGAVVGGFPLRAMFGLDQGFAHYDDAIPSAEDRWLERPAADISTAALAWLRSLRSPTGHWRSPWFLWVHYYNPHDPYTPPPGFARPGPRGAYDGEVASVDEAIGALRRGIAELVPDSNILTVVTADHGESLGEHGELTHGFFVYDSTLLVPLIVHFPGHFASALSPAPARLIDITPTLLELLALPPVTGNDGVSLRPTLIGETQTIPPAYVESQQPWLGYGWTPLTAIRTAEWKFINAPQAELYRLARDPTEMDNRIAFEPDVSASLRKMLAGEPITSGTPVGETPALPDSDAVERLRGLGYLGGGTAPSETPPPTLADPKERLGQKLRLDEAEAALQGKDYAGAMANFEVVLATEPDNRYALLRSGVALQQQGRWREALPRFEHLLRLSPTHPEARYAVAEVLTQLGELTRAAVEWRTVVQQQPRRAVAWSNLGIVLLQSGQHVPAEEAFARAVAITPDDQVLRENLGECRYQLALTELRAGRRESAHRALQAAIAVQPDLRQRAARDARLAALL